MGSCSDKKENLNQNPRLQLKTRNDNSITMKDDGKPLEAKVVLLGDQNVGKSSIAQRFCKNVYTNSYIVTIGGAYLQQKITLSNGVTMKLHIWDTGGQERFRSMANLYYQDAAAAILTYDVTNEKTLQSLNYWIDELKNKLNQDKIVICIAGNKCDCDPNERKVPTISGKQLADQNNMIFAETSAKADLGIKDLFQNLGRRIYETKFSGKAK